MIFGSFLSARSRRIGIRSPNASLKPESTRHPHQVDIPCAATLDRHEDPRINATCGAEGTVTIRVVAGTDRYTISQSFANAPSRNSRSMYRTEAAGEPHLHMHGPVTFVRTRVVDDGYCEYEESSPRRRHCEICVHGPRLHVSRK